MLKFGLKILCNFSDVNAWIGAIERFSQIGIKKIKQFTEDFNFL